MVPRRLIGIVKNLYKFYHIIPEKTTIYLIKNDTKFTLCIKMHKK